MFTAQNLLEQPEQNGWITQVLHEHRAYSLDSPCTMPTLRIARGEHYLLYEISLNELRLIEANVAPDHTFVVLCDSTTEIKSHEELSALYTKLH